MHRERALAAFLTSGLAAAGCTDRVLLDDAATVGTFTPEDDDTSMDVSGDDDGVPPPDSDGEPPPPVDTDGDPPPTCGDIVIAPELPVSLGGEFVQGPSRYEPSCVGAQSAEITFAFTAPQDGAYIVDTVGSTFDTVLYAYGPDCQPPELTCNDDAGGTLASSIGLSMVAGETVVIVLDSFGETGSWALHVREGSLCPEAELEPSPEVQIESLLDEMAPDSVAPSCGGAGPDVTYLWTPPVTGRYRFTTVGSDFDTVLSVHSADCVTELACNDDAQGDVSSSLDLDVTEGVPIVVAVGSFDLFTGFFRLSIFPV